MMTSNAASLIHITSSVSVQLFNHVRHAVTSCEYLGFHTSTRVECRRTPVLLARVHTVGHKVESLRLLLERIVRATSPRVPCPVAAQLLSQQKSYQPGADMSTLMELPSMLLMTIIMSRGVETLRGFLATCTDATWLLRLYLPQIWKHFLIQDFPDAQKLRLVSSTWRDQYKRMEMLHRSEPPKRIRNWYLFYYSFSVTIEDLPGAATFNFQPHEVVGHCDELPIEWKDRLKPGVSRVTIYIQRPTGEIAIALKSIPLHLHSFEDDETYILEASHNVHTMSFDDDSLPFQIDGNDYHVSLMGVECISDTKEDFHQAHMKLEMWLEDEEGNGCRPASNVFTTPEEKEEADRYMADFLYHNLCWV